MDSNYNLAGLIARIKDKLDDQEYPEETITQFINDAYFNILGDEEYQFLERLWKTSTQQSGQLPLPSDYQSLIALTAKNDKGTKALNYMAKDDFFSHDKESKGYCYTIFGNQLFYDLPSIVGEDEDGEQKFYDINLFYLAKPKVLVKPSDKPVIPYEFGEALVLGALARCERRRDNFDFAGIYENKQDEIITNMKLRYCPRQMANANRAKLPVRVRTWN